MNKLFTTALFIFIFSFGQISMANDMLKSKLDSQSFNDMNLDFDVYSTFSDIEAFHYKLYSVDVNGFIKFEFDFDLPFDIERFDIIIDTSFYHFHWRVIPVPEPEIYAMLLVGLSLIGFVACRGKETAV